MSIVELRSRKQVDKAGHRFKRFKEEPLDRLIIQAYRDFRSQELPELFSRITASLESRPAVLSARAKRTDTIIRKLRREQTMQLTSVADIVGFRVIVDSVATQRTVVSAIQGVLELASDPKDYVSEPTASGYQGVHLIGTMMRRLPGAAAPNRCFFEIQVRTEYQHMWATESESFGEQTKEGGGSALTRQYLKELSKSIRTYEKENPGTAQRRDLTSTGGQTFWTMVYDKKQGEVIDTDTHGSDLAVAIRYFSWLEDAHSSNLNKEVVLLSAPTGEAELGITHSRYFHYRGRPPIPSHLLEGISRP